MAAVVQTGLVIGDRLKLSIKPKLQGKGGRARGQKSRKGRRSPTKLRLERADSVRSRSISLRSTAPKQPERPKEISPEKNAILSLVSAGKVSWNGGKPTGLTGVRAPGKSVAEIVIEDRR